jgi:dienelactone hydrolase
LEKLLNIPRSAFVLAIATLLSTCKSASTLTDPPIVDGFHLTGDPAATDGATWTLQGTIDGVHYDLQGVLYKPQGSGPFPAVILSHGAGGSSTVYGRRIARELVTWGLVAIATNYTHAGGVPLGAPGTASEVGASRANVLRAHMAYEILRTLGYVDMQRVAAHGHSMGAYVTTALTGTYPQSFRVASHTAGGVRLAPFTSGPAPSETDAAGIRAAYQIHHGDQDVVVPISMDQRLSELLVAGQVEQQFHVYAGAGHNDIVDSALMFQRVRAWYQSHGLF